MRILVVAPGPGFSVADVQHGWEKALAALGNTVRTYNLDDRISFFGAAEFEDYGKLSVDDVVSNAIEGLGAACYRFWPDVIIVVSGFFIPDYLWDIWRRGWHKTVLLCTESPYEDDRQLTQVMDWEPTHVLLNDPVNLLKFKEKHPSVWYAPHAYDPQVHHPGGARAGYESDFAFVGTGYPSRLDFFARTDWRDIDVKLAGMWKNVGGTCLEPFVMHHLEECFDNADAADLYRSCKISANLYRGGMEVEANAPALRDGWAVGPREIELAASGTFFLREPRAEGDELFPMLPTFTEPGEFSELLRYYLAHEDKRLHAAARAREAITDRTFDANARHLMQLLSN